MDFEFFKDKVPNLKKITLPGEEAHYILAPLFRVQELEKNGQISNAKNAGVLSVFYPSPKNKVNFVLILRKTYKGVHSNQVGFPGGRVEKEDLNIEHTALRETEEEVGLARAFIEPLGAFDIVDLKLGDQLLPGATATEVLPAELAA